MLNVYSISVICMYMYPPFCVYQMSNAGKARAWIQVPVMS